MEEGPSKTYGQRDAYGGLHRALYRQISRRALVLGLERRDSWRVTGSPTVCRAWISLLEKLGPTPAERCRESMTRGRLHKHASCTADSAGDRMRSPTFMITARKKKRRRSPFGLVPTRGSKQVQWALGIVCKRWQDAFLETAEAVKLEILINCERRVICFKSRLSAVD